MSEDAGNENRSLPLACTIKNLTSTSLHHRGGERGERKEGEAPPSPAGENGRRVKIILSPASARKIGHNVFGRSLG